MSMLPHWPGHFNLKAQPEDRSTGRREQAFDYNHSGEYARRGPSTFGGNATQGPSSSGGYARRGPSTASAYATQGPSSSEGYVRRGPSTSSAYVTQGPSSSEGYARRGPSTSGTYATQGPSSSEGYARRGPSTWGAYAYQGPSTFDGNASQGPSSSGGYTRRGPSTSSAYAGQGPSNSGAYAYQGLSTSGGFTTQGPSSSGGYGPIARKLLGLDGQSEDATKDNKHLSRQENNKRNLHKRPKTEAEEAVTSTAPGTKRLDALENSAEIRSNLILLKARLAESPLPNEFDSLVTQLSCALCGIVGTKAPKEEKYMKPHWGSPMHRDNVHDWLTEWYQELRADEDKWENRPKAYEYEEDETFCYVCMKPFSGAEMAYTHYDSKQHEKRIVNKLTDIAIGKYYELEQFKCDICNVASTTRAQLDVHLDSPNHAKKLRALGVNVIVPISIPNNDQKNKMKYECKICKIKTYTEEILQVHMSSARHLRKLKKVSGEGLVDADGCGSATIFTYKCEICNVKADTYELLDVHISSKKHKLRSEKKYGEDKKEKAFEIRPKKLSDEYRCDICNVTANAPGQYKMHMDSPKHAKALARHLAEIENKEKAVAAATSKKRKIDNKEKEEEEEDENASFLPRPLSAATAGFLRRQNKMFNLILQGVQMPQQTPIYKEAYAVEGICDRMFVLVQRGEYMWQTLVRNQNVWKIPLACSTKVIFGGEKDVWVGGCSLGKMTAKAEGPDMCTSRSAAAELLLHKLQSRYYQLEMPKDRFKKIEFVGKDDEEEEEEKEEAEEGMMYYSDDDDDDGMEGDLSRLYVVNRDNFANKDFKETVEFYLEDYLMNPEDFRDLVFFKCNRAERSLVREMSADRGLIAEYRKSKEGVVVLVSKIITIYMYEPWLFLKVVIHYKDQFKDWSIVKPGTEKIGLYPTVKYIDADVF